MIFSLLLLILISMFGVIGFAIIEGKGLVDAIYMTVITMSTVGFGWTEEPSEAGKVFSVILIIFSAGTFVYAITTLTTFIVEGEVRKLVTTYQVNKKVAKLDQHIIICGLGRNGREAAMELWRQGKQFIIIESDEEVIERFRKIQPDALFILGDATREEILAQAQIGRAKGLVSALSSDAENVYITLTARGLHPQLKIIGRASKAEAISKLKRAGANEVIVPNAMGGRKMVNMITRPALVEFVEMVSGEGNPHWHLKQITCQEGDKLVGSTLKELQIRSKTGVLVLGYKRPNYQTEINPPADRKIQVGDGLFMLGTDAQLTKFHEAYQE